MEVEQGYLIVLFVFGVHLLMAMGVVGEHLVTSPVIHSMEVEEEHLMALQVMVVYYLIAMVVELGHLMEKYFQLTVLEAPGYLL